MCVPVRGTPGLQLSKSKSLGQDGRSLWACQISWSNDCWMQCHLLKMRDYCNVLPGWNYDPEKTKYQLFLVGSHTQFVWLRNHYWQHHRATGGGLQTNSWSQYSTSPLSRSPCPFAGGLKHYYSFLTYLYMALHRPCVPKSTGVIIPPNPLPQPKTKKQFETVFDKNGAAPSPNACF